MCVGKNQSGIYTRRPTPALFWLLPWHWEEDVNATRYLGFPVVGRFSPGLLRTQIQASITSSLNKMKLRHLTLAGRVLVANSLILSSIWFFLILWAGDFTFFTQLQSQIDYFVWGGRSRVSRNAVTQPKSDGGLGLLLIVEQYRAIIGILCFGFWERLLTHSRRYSDHTFVLSHEDCGGLLISLEWYPKVETVSPLAQKYGGIFAQPGTFSSPSLFCSAHGMLWSGNFFLCGVPI